MKNENCRLAGERDVQASRAQGNKSVRIYKYLLNFKSHLEFEMLKEVAESMAKGIFYLCYP